MNNAWSSLPDDQTLPCGTVRLRRLGSAKENSGSGLAGWGFLLISYGAHTWTNGQISEPMKHDDEVRSAQFSSDGQRVVTASYDTTARVWDAATGKALSEPMKHDGRSIPRSSVPMGNGW